MTIRLNCPACDAPNTVDEEQRGSKVRCRKCKAPFTVPAKKKAADEDALQEGRKLKTKTAAARKGADPDDDDDRPVPKKQPAKSSGFPVLLLVGGAAALLLLLVVTAAGVGGFFWLRARQSEHLLVEAVEEARPVENKNEVKKEPEPKKDGEPDKLPEPKVDPEPKNDPDPQPDPKPRPKKKKKDPDPIPIPPKGEPLTPELEKVKRATVHVRALRPDGKWTEGSGFFMEPTVIVTNAHVLGMLDPKAPPPNDLEVIINGGEPNEKKVKPGYTVDRANDLAILQFPKVDGVPAALTFEDPGKYSEKQKVHIAGYPYGRKDRKDPTVTDTEITMLKRAGGGSLEEIQVAGGMSPGTSGGPVVTPAGNVVGVALGQVKDKEIYLAIPTELVKRMLDGKVGDLTMEKPRPFGDKTIVSGTVPLIDPKQRIKEVRVEVWTGNATPGRPYSYTQPTKLTGDSDRQSQPLTMQGVFASGSITIPATIPSGQVAWAQPVIVLKDSSMQWGDAVVMPLPTSPYDRRPANLIANFTTPKERTVKLRATMLTTTKLGTGISRTDADILEVVTPNPDGGAVSTAFGTLAVVTEAGGQNVQTPKDVLDQVRLNPTSYLFDAFAKIKNRTYRIPKDQREVVLTQLYSVGTSYEAVLTPLPNKQVQPSETWNTSTPVAVRDKQKTGEIFLDLTNTYEGIQIKAKQRSEAVITVKGKVKVLDAAFKNYEADVTGTIGFDVAGGYISSTQLKLTRTDPDFSYTMDIDMTRRSGNPLKIQLPQEPKSDPKPDPKVAKSKVILDKKASLTGTDPSDPALSQAKKKAHYKEYTHNLEAGKNYQIEVKSTAFDALVKVQGPAGMQVAQGQHRVNLRAPATGAYRIHVVGSNHKTGAFHLIVTENP